MERHDHDRAYDDSATTIRLTFPPARFTSAERAEIARLFRSKLASLRDPKRAAPPRPRRPRSVRLPDEQPDDDALLRPGELAALLGKLPRTVRQWDLPCVRTIGGQLARGVDQFEKASRLSTLDGAATAEITLARTRACTRPHTRHRLSEHHVRKCAWPAPDFAST